MPTMTEQDKYHGVLPIHAPTAVEPWKRFDLWLTLVINYNDDSRLLLLIIFRNDGTGFCCLRGFRTRKIIRKCSIAFLKEKSLTQPADSINDDHLCINKACDAKTHCSSKNHHLYVKKKENQVSFGAFKVFLVALWVKAVVGRKKMASKKISIL